VTVPATRAPVLFLDFDGVLNHSATQTWFTFPDGAAFKGLDPENVARLNAICELVPEARIVVSSTWRTVLDLAGLREALRQFGFAYPERVIDRTPGWRTVAGGGIVGAYAERGHEIQAWLDAQPEAPSTIAILDDAEDMVHLAPHLVRTDMWGGGLLDTDALAVAEMLASAPDHFPSNARHGAAPLAGLTPAEEHGSC
jgi:hypothetical protein